MDFCNFLKNFFANFRKFSRIRGGGLHPPRTPYEAGHKPEPPKFFPAYASVSEKVIYATAICTTITKDSLC